MTKDEFNSLWNLNYPNTPPISYLFRQIYNERWFRIHSLSNSKRYPENEEDWKILLSRQNEIITDLLGFRTPVFLVTGLYEWDEIELPVYIPQRMVFSKYSIQKWNRFKLDDFELIYPKEGGYFAATFAPIIWKPASHNKLIRKIAEDNVRAFFVFFDQNTLIAPYDGGIDFILKDTIARDHFKDKYRKWQSVHPDGL